MSESLDHQGPTGKSAYLIFTLLRFRFIGLNLLFIAYLWLLQPIVLHRLVASAKSAQPDWQMGGLLLGIQAAEFFGLILKRPLTAYYARLYPSHGGKVGSGTDFSIAFYILALIFHLCFSVFLALMAFDLMGFGLADETTASQGFLLVFLVFVFIFKDALFIVLTLSVAPLAGQALSSSYSRLDTQLRRWIEPAVITQVSLKDAVKDVFGDLLLLGYAALAYTASWEFIATDASMHRPRHLFEFIGVSIFFFMVYLSTRLTTLIQEITIEQSRRARILSWISFLVVWLSALLTIPAG